MDLQALVDGSWVGTPDREVRSPYDSSVVGRVPSTARCRRRRRERSTRRRRRWPVTTSRGRGGSRCSTARRARCASGEEFARIIAEEAAKPIKTARVEAERAVGTFQFAAAEARTLRRRDGAARRRAPPARASSASRCACRSASSARSRRSTSRSTSSPTSSRRRSPPGCPVVLKPASQTPFSAIALGRAADRRVRPAARSSCTSSPAAAARSATPSSTTPTSPSITFTGSPAVGWGIRARAPRKRVGLELGNNAPVDHRARRRLAGGGRQDPRRRLLPRRAELHLDAADLRAPLDRRRLHGRARRGASAALVVGDPLDEATDVSALISPAETRPGRVVGRRGVGRRRQGARPAASSTTTACCGRRCSPTSRRT